MQQTIKTKLIKQYYWCNEDGEPLAGSDYKNAFYMLKTRYDSEQEAHDDLLNLVKSKYWIYGDYTLKTVYRVEEIE